MGKKRGEYYCSHFMEEDMRAYRDEMVLQVFQTFQKLSVEIAD